MGLLEKAEKIQSEEEEQVPTAGPPKAVIVQEPEPEQKKTKKAKKARPRRERKEKKTKKERVAKVMPEGFEPAARVRTSFRYLVDTTANWGILIITGLIMSQADADPTIPIIVALALALGNMIYLPSKISRSAGNIVTGTQFVDTRGNNPQFLYHLAKSANIPLILAGLFGMLLLISEGTEWTNGNKIFVGTSMTLLLVPLLDRFLRKRGDEKLGFWDRLFGGVWLVTAEKTESDSGLIKRLQSIGEYAEQRGMMAEDDENVS
ncbi:MAG TPA: hypothetical protein EYQ15_01590 [Candidatus Poseidoniales archaeon]|jgi:hypothetical protein|nr:hypothetical protein [Candidatus Poseidoniales archaeon]